MRLRRGATIALVAVSVLLGSAFSASAAPKRYTGYVALGDSYTAGPLIPVQRLDPLGCLRSLSDYPAQLAARLLPKSWRDVSCSGADTSDMTTAQAVPLGSNPPQLNALDANTDLVTIGIGGNDGDLFGTIVGECPGLRASDPAGNPCQRHFTVDGVDTIKAKLPATQANITKVLSKIHERAPHAKVLAIGYPRIAPPQGTCPDVLPFADGDYAWLNSVEQTLDKAVSDAVSADGSSSYVDTYGPSLGHDACAGGQAWINGKDLKPTAAPYHPNFAGMTGLASIIRAKLG